MSCLHSPAQDMLLCLLLPLVIRNLLPSLQEQAWALLSRLRGRGGGRDQYVQRIISHSITDGCFRFWFSDDDDAPNHLLQAAILLRINALGVAAKLPTAQMRLQKNRGRQSEAACPP